MQILHRFRFLSFPALLMFSCCLWGSWSASAVGQEAEPEPEAEPGLAILDKAMQTKLGAVRLKDLEDVIKYCGEAIEAGLSDANEAFARQMMTSTLYERAERLVEPILEGNIDGTWARRREMALDSLRKVIKLDEKNGDAYLLLAKLCRLPRGDLKAGRAAAENAVELLSAVPARRSEALVVKAQFAEKVEERIAILDEAIAADGGNFDAWRDRGDAKLISGDSTSAVEDYQHILEKDEGNIGALEQIVRAFAANKKFDEATEYADKVIAIDPESASGYAMRSRLYLMQDKQEDALDDLDTAVDLAPGDVRFLMMRAGVLELNEDYEEALGDVDRVLEIRPGLQDALLLRAEIAISGERYADAIISYKELIERQPGNFQLQIQLAVIYGVDSRPRRAVELYTSILEAVEEGPDADDSEEISALKWQVLRGRADVRLAIGAHAEAVADYEAAMQIDPEDDGILNNLAWVLSTSPKDDVRDAKRSIKLAKQACELTDYEAPHILSTLAACYAESGDFDEAKKWSAKAVEMGDGELKDQLTEELESYENEKPWRELQEQEENPDPEPELGLSDDLLLDAEAKANESEPSVLNQGSKTDG